MSDCEKKVSTLDNLPIGKTATVVHVGGEGVLRQHFLDMGIIPHTGVSMVKHAPMGDPVEVRIREYALTLRLDDAKKIEVDNIRDSEQACREPRVYRPLPHPGLGEGGKFHDKTVEQPIPESQTLTFALVGNQNCGKTEASVVCVVESTQR